MAAGGLALGGAGLELVPASVAAAGGFYLGGLGAELARVAELGTGGVQLGGSGPLAVVDGGEYTAGGFQVGGFGVETYHMAGELLAQSGIQTDEVVNWTAAAVLPTPDRATITLTQTTNIIVYFECNMYGQPSSGVLGTTVFYDGTQLNTETAELPGINSPLLAGARFTVTGCTAGTHTVEVRFNTGAGGAIHVRNRLLLIWRGL
jgi:hypothetical protein